MQKFINTYGIPKNPADLASLPIAAWRFGHGPITWQLGELGELAPMLANPLLQSGELVEVLVDYPLPEVYLHIIYPSRKHLSRLSKVFIADFIAFCHLHQNSKYLFNQ